MDAVFVIIILDTALPCWSWKEHSFFFSLNCSRTSPLMSIKRSCFNVKKWNLVDHTEAIWTRDWLYNKIQTQYKTSPNPNLCMITLSIFYPDSLQNDKKLSTFPHSIWYRRCKKKKAVCSGKWVRSNLVWHYYFKVSQYDQISSTWSWSNEELFRVLQSVLCISSPVEISHVLNTSRSATVDNGCQLILLCQQLTISVSNP